MSQWQQRLDATPSKLGVLLLQNSPQPCAVCATVGKKVQRPVVFFLAADQLNARRACAAAFPDRLLQLAAAEVAVSRQHTNLRAS